MFRFCSLTLTIVFGALVFSAGPAYAQGDGAKVYAAQKCTMCHSIAGVGNKKLPLDGVGTKLSADQIREWIVTPVEAAKKANSSAKPAMRAYPALPKADLDALVVYMKSLAK